MFDYTLMSENVKEMNTTQLTHNQFFIKDGEAWYRDFDREISCRNLVREIAIKQGIWKSPHKYGLDADNEMVDDDIFDDTMLDALMYGTDEPIGVLAMYYTAMWGMAEVRAWYIEEKAKKATKADLSSFITEFIIISKDTILEAFEKDDPDIIQDEALEYLENCGE